MDLVFASANSNKTSEIRAVLPPAIELVTMAESGINDAIAETGKTIRENAEIKALFVAGRLKAAGKNTAVFADDSGLEVDALHGAPGVYSARYAGEPGNDAANNKKLLQELQGVTSRKARFVTVICLIMNGQTHFFDGEVKGTIAYEARGNGGFGYDPLFIPRGYRSSFAELGNGVKNSISHRTMAVKALCGFLEKQL